MEKYYKIFLDDNKIPEMIFNDSNNWIVVKNYDLFVNLINEILNKADKWIKVISFDYILNDRKDGIDCLIFFLDICIKYGLSIPILYLHSNYIGIYDDFYRIIKDYEIKLGIKIDLRKTAFFYKTDIK